MLQETVGSQDQVMAAYGGCDTSPSSPTAKSWSHPLILPRRRIAELKGHLMLFYTGIARTAADVAQTRSSASAGAAELHLMKELVEESIDVLASGMDIGLRRPAARGWQAKRSLSAGVQRRGRRAVRAARAAGAVGGKLTGAGGGGFLLLFVPPEQQARVKERLKHLVHVPFGFDEAGSRVVLYQPNGLH